MAQSAKLHIPRNILPKTFFFGKLFSDTDSDTVLPEFVNKNVNELTINGNTRLEWATAIDWSPNKLDLSFETIKCIETFLLLLLIRIYDCSIHKLFSLFSKHEVPFWRYRTVHLARRIFMFPLSSETMHWRRPSRFAGDKAS